MAARVILSGINRVESINYQLVLERRLMADTPLLLVGFSVSMTTDQEHGFWLATRSVLPWP